jgi:hypothetical protein
MALRVGPYSRCEIIINTMTPPETVIDWLIRPVCVNINNIGRAYAASLSAYEYPNYVYQKETGFYELVCDISLHRTTLEALKKSSEDLFKTAGALEACHEVIKSSVRLINPTVLYLGLGAGLTTIGVIGILFSSWLQGKKIANSNTKSKITPVMIRNISAALAFSGLALTVVTIFHLWKSGKAYRNFLETGRIDTHGVKADLYSKVIKLEPIADRVPLMRRSIADACQN